MSWSMYEEGKQPAGDSRIRIGWASASITPDKPVQLGGQFHERISTHVNDPCKATVLAITSGPDDKQIHEQAVLVSCDLASVGEDYLAALRVSVASRIPELDVAKISVNCTHSHTAPVTRAGLYPTCDREHVMLPDAYAAFWSERVTQAIVEAWAARTEGAISSALGHAVLGWPRRAIFADGKAVMYGKTHCDDFRAMEGPADPGMELLFTWDRDDQLTGIVAAVACPAQVVESCSFVSADFWYPASEKLRARFGPQVHVLGMISAAGDQSPRDQVRKGRGIPAMNSIEGMNELGRRLANGVIDAFEHSQSPRDAWPVFMHEAINLDLPMQQIERMQYDAAQRELANLPANPQPGSRDEGVMLRQKKIISRFEAQKPDDVRPTEVHVLRLGDVAMVTCPFELYLDYGQQIRARSQAMQTFVIQLANGKGQYLPTARAMQHGGYSATAHSIQVGPAGGQMLVDELVTRINAMFAPSPAHDKQREA